MARVRMMLKNVEKKKKFDIVVPTVVIPTGVTSAKLTISLSENRVLSSAAEWYLGLINTAA